MTRPHDDILAALHERLHPLGFDVFGSVAVGTYNDDLEPRHREFALPTLGDPRSMAVLIGNTKRLWPLFLRAYHDSDSSHEAHPLDAYSRLHIGAAAADVAASQRLAHAVRFSFDSPPQGVAVQRLARLTGAAEVSPVGLSVHPIHGPWFSLRAAVIFDVPGPSACAPSPTCTSCVAKPCIEKRARVIDQMGVALESMTSADFAANWEAWVEMRSACPVGRDARYGTRQMRYHYLKDRSALDPVQDYSR